MISIDDHPPPDPSSSHHHHQQQHQISHDLKLSDIDLKSPDADDLDGTNNQLPNFSIRDYVFGLRSKDVACNWPFSPTSLQLCLKHGVKNLLPPFQSLDLMKNNSSVTRCSLENLLRDEETIIRKPRNDQVKSNGEQASVSVTVSTNSSGSKRDNESQFHFKQNVAHVRSKKSHHTENIKKSKAVMKLNLGVELVEEIAMSSKICPVCKIFSSSSNTTLNAHIDQCLTGDQGTMKWSTDQSPKVVVKHRVKPRKTRLMVEIYKTAPRCTIEELDRRNGTSWATNSSFPAQEIQFQGDDEEEEKQGDDDEEEKQEGRTTTTLNRDVADNEGDVYIDTDGTKVRILSVPKSGSLDNNNNHGNRKFLKGVKGSKFVMGKKKFKSDLHDRKQKLHKKFLKLSPNAKKLCSPKLQARNCQEDDENCIKDDRPTKLMNDRLTGLTIVRPPWSCSKRTNLAKRKHRKNFRVESDTSPPLSSDDVALSESRKKTRTSSPLMVEFRKESSRMHDDDDNDSSPDSRNSDGFDIRGKGSGKFLRKNLPFPASKLVNLKRKSSFNETFNGDSSKEKSRNEEHGAVRRNKETRSVSSRSTSNEEEEESSSVGVQTADVDVESDRNETETLSLPNVDQVCVIQPPNFTGLSNAFDPDFSKCVEMYQEQLLCSTNRAQDVEKHDLFFHEDDPIPIPGPPGSFLPPSPGGDIVSDEQLQANSSSTTATRIEIEIENRQHDTMDRDSMSNSPVSTVSNPSNLARSDSRSTSVVQDQNTHTKSFTSFKNDQPCCCSRKDTAFSYNQESNKNPSGFNFRSDTFPLSNYSTSQTPPENAIFPTEKKLPVYSDNCDSAASPSKPVLRLMEKNLTVVKTDEDLSPSSSQPFRPPPQLTHPPPPVIFSQFQNGSESQGFNAYPHFQSRGGFMAPMDRYGHGGSYMGHTPNKVPNARSHHGHNSNEIIIIDHDDHLENDSMRNEILRRNHGQINPLYTMYNHHAQSSGHLYSGGGGGSTVFHSGSFSGDLGKWNVGSSSSPSRSTSHMRSSTSYYPPPSSYP